MTTIKKTNQTTKKKNNKTNKHLKNKKNINKNLKYNTNKTKKGGADFFGGLIQVPEKKNYNTRLPGSRYVKLLNPNLYVSKPNSYNNKSDQLKVVFNYRDRNQLDIANLPDNTVIDSTLTTSEPYVFINSYKYKFILVMYRQVINIDKTYKNLLHWLIGYYHRNYTRIFPYIEPDVRAGFRNKYTIKIYKCPETDTNNNFLKINNIDQAKAYEEFNAYMNKTKLTLITTINFSVKGNPNKGFNLFNMINRGPKQ